MTSRNHITLFGLLCAAWLPACVDDAVVGTSGQIDVELQQATLGQFAADSSTAIADVNGDGFGDLIVWTNAGPSPEEVVPPSGSLPIGVYVFFGSEARFAAQLGPEDADVRLTLRAGDFVARVAGQDLDGDGKAELVVHAAAESTGSFPSTSWWMDREGGGLFVVRGAALTPGVHVLAGIAELIPAYAYGREYVVRANHAYRDLDGVAGAEFMTEPYRLTEAGVSSINVRDLATGETRARPIAPDREYLDVRGVLDHDGDGVSDVVVAYVRIREGSSDANPNNPGSWEDLGIGVFYGPITGDIALGDEGTQHISVPVPFRHAQPSFIGGGAARTLVGDVCGDETEDVVIGLSSGSTLGLLFCLVGGSRDALTTPDGVRLTFPPEQVQIIDPSWMMIARPQDQARSRLFVMGGNSFSFFAPTLQSVDAMLGVLVNRVALWYDTAPATPLFTHMGGAMGDLDGDGLLDVALGSQARELQPGSFVHVIYGFGG